MSTKEALQNWMVGFVNENTRREQLTYMQRYFTKPFEVIQTEFLQRIRIMTALLEFLPTTEKRLRSMSKDELKYIYVYAMTNLFFKHSATKEQARNVIFLGFRKLLSRYVEKSKSYPCTSVKFVKKKENKYQWGEEHEKAFNKIKEIISKDVMLAFPNFDKKLILYSDASALQLGAVNMQGDKPIAFYSRKPTET